MKAEIHFTPNSSRDHIDCIKSFCKWQDIKYEEIESLKPYDSMTLIWVVFDGYTIDGFDDFYEYINENGLRLL